MLTDNITDYISSDNQVETKSHIDEPRLNMYNFFLLSTLFATMAVGSALPSEATEEFPLLTTHGQQRLDSEHGIESFPYLVSLCETLPDGTQYIRCGGTIISDKWILTAARCVHQSDCEPHHAYHIVMGSNSSCDQGSFHEISKAIPHEKFQYVYNSTYSAIAVVNDIALLKLKESIEFDSVRKPVGLYNQSERIAVGSNGIVSGWGYIDKNGNEFPGMIHSNIVELIDPNTCSGSVYPGLLLPGQICTMPSCVGDVGGPLIINGRVAGIISLGEKCIPSPGFYTAISFYRDWIKRISNV